MERTREQLAEERESAARKLELSALKIEDGRIRGTVKGFGVSLEGEAPFHTCVIDLGSPLPIAKLVLQPGDLNHPDAVETGDPNFDEVMQVLAQPGLGPTALKILADPNLRRVVHELLRQHPDSAVSGQTLTLRSKDPIDHALVLEAVEVARALTTKFAEIGFVETEDRPALPGDALSRQEATGVRVNIVVVSAISLFLFWVGAQFFDASPTVTAAVLGGGALLAALRVWGVGLRVKKE